MTLDARPRAIDFLRTTLAAGERPSATLIAEAQSQGISERTLRRAFRDLGGLARKAGFGAGAAWMWRLEKTGESHEHCQAPPESNPPTITESACPFVFRSDRIDPCQICGLIRRVAFVQLAPNLAIYCCQPCIEDGKAAAWAAGTLVPEIRR